MGVGKLERTSFISSENYITKFLDHQPLNAGDSILVYSHSGRNAAGIETALYAKKRDLFVVAVTSTKMLDKPATHSSGKRLARKSHTPHASTRLLRARKLLNRRCTSV